MTRKTVLMLTVAPALALAVAAGAVQARGPGEHDRMGGRPAAMMPDFATLDTDGDGKITRAELDARRADRQKAMDADGDGFVTLEEMKAHAAAEAAARAETMAARMFERADADKDGKLSVTELDAASPRRQAGLDRMFARIDQDGDGAISQAEYDRMAARMQEGRRGHGEGRGDGQGKLRN